MKLPSRMYRSVLQLSVVTCWKSWKMTDRFIQRDMNWRRWCSVERLSFCTEKSSLQTGNRCRTCVVLYIRWDAYFLVISLDLALNSICTGTEFDAVHLRPCIATSFDLFCRQWICDVNLYDCEIWVFVDSLSELRMH